MKRYSIIIFAFLLVGFSSCQKQDEWLEKKRNLTDVRPETLKDYQAILNNVVYFNSGFTYGLIGSDNLYITDEDMATLVPYQRNLYLWQKDVWELGLGLGWSRPFVSVEMASVVLDGLAKLEGQGAEYNNILGQAYFHRARAFFILAELFCKPYDASSSASDPGIPLRLSSDVNVTEQRSTLQQTYDQIISELELAAANLSDVAPTPYRAIRAAAMGQLAIVYLTMGDYPKALAWAEKALSLQGGLLDFNSGLISLDQTYRFPDQGTDNPEIIFYVDGGDNATWPGTFAAQYVDQQLYDSYDPNDLRRLYFYDDTEGPERVRFRGSYSGNTDNFCGIAVNELLLIKAECLARTGEVNKAMEALNALLVKRYREGTFTPYVAAEAQTALTTILAERRKELPFTANVRWDDLRRLNKDPLFQKTLTRQYLGQTYQLLPNGNNYVLPIPQEEIDMVGLQQNPRD